MPEGGVVALFLDEEGGDGGLLGGWLGRGESFGAGPEFFVAGDGGGIFGWAGVVGFDGLYGWEFFCLEGGGEDLA